MDIKHWINLSVDPKVENHHNRKSSNADSESWQLFCPDRFLNLRLTRSSVSNYNCMAVANLCWVSLKLLSEFRVTVGLPGSVINQSGLSSWYWPGASGSVFFTVSQALLCGKLTKDCGLPQFVEESIQSVTYVMMTCTALVSRKTINLIFRKLNKVNEPPRYHSMRFSESLED
jgi:hypothetical protein